MKKLLLLIIPFLLSTTFAFGETYRVRHLGGNRYKVDNESYTVLPAPEGTHSYQQSASEQLSGVSAAAATVFSNMLAQNNANKNQKNNKK